MNSFIHSIIILFLLYVNVIMGQIAVGNTVLDSVWVASNSYAIIFGFTVSFSLVSLNKSKIARSIYFLSTLLLLYTNYTMSLLSEGIPCEEIFLAYLNVDIFFAAFFGSFLIYTLRTLAPNKISFLSELKFREKDKIYYYFITTFIMLETNVSMEMIHIETSMANIFNTNVLLLAIMVIFVSILMQILLFREKNETNK